MFAFKLTLAVLGVLVVLQTVLSLLRGSSWWLRIFDFPRPQIAGGSIGLLGLFGFANVGIEAALPGEDILLVLMSLAVAVQSWQMLPYTPLWKRQVPDAAPGAPLSDRLRIVVSNVRMDNRRHDRWLATIRAEHPDLIVVVEIDSRWQYSLRALESDYPHRLLLPQDNTYGLALYSRLPLLDREVRHLVEQDVPSLFATVRLRSGRCVRCVALHPRPPRPDIAQDSDFRDAELARAADVVRKPAPLPLVVVGDLNDVAWSHTTHRFQRLARVLDPRIGRGLFATFHAEHRFFRYPLDHVFHSNDFDLVELRRLPYVGSDHFPILIEIVLRPPTAPRPKIEAPEPGDHIEAAEAISDARRSQAEETPRERDRRKRADR